MALRIAPTFETGVTSSFQNSTTPRNSAAAVNCDTVVVAMFDEAYGGTDNYNFSDDGLYIWTENIPAPTSGADAYAQFFTAYDPSGVVFNTVSLARSAGGTGQFFGFHLMGFENSDGVAATAVSDVTASQVDITTTKDHSTVVVLIADYAATDQSLGTLIQVGGVNPTVSEQFQAIGAYSGTVLRYTDVGAAGTKTVGLTGLTGATPLVMAVEVYGYDSPDPGYGKIVLEDGSGNLELENTTDDYLLDTTEGTPASGSGSLTLGATGRASKLFSTLTTNFADTATWTASGSATTTSTRLSMNTGGGAVTSPIYSLDETRVFWKVAQLQTTGTLVMSATSAASPSQDLSWSLLANGNLTISDISGVLDTVVFNAGEPYLSFAESGGNISFDTSPSGQPGTWNELVSTPAGVSALDGLTLDFTFVGGGTGTAWIEDVNTPAAAATARLRAVSTSNPAISRSFTR